MVTTKQARRARLVAELRRFWRQLPLLIGLVVLWMFLWGEISWFSAVTGLIIGIGVSMVFFLPPVLLSGRFNLWWCLVFLAQFFFELTVASFQVLWVAIRPRGAGDGAMIAVPLVTHSDFVLSLTATAVSLVPGTLVIEVDRERSIMYLHVLDVRGPEHLDQVRAHVRHVERGVIRVLGPRDELEAAR